MQCKHRWEPFVWLSRDEARLALWEAINKREFGNPTDDKLILEHLRQNGLWIGKYTSPPAQPQQEPVAQYIGEGYEGSLVQLYDDVKKGTNFYTTSPQRKPMTDEEVSDQQCRRLLYGFMLDFNAVGFEQAGRNLHRAMKEAAHGIKENT